MEMKPGDRARCTFGHYKNHIVEVLEVLNFNRTAYTCRVINYDKEILLFSDELYQIMTEVDPDGEEE